MHCVAKGHLDHVRLGFTHARLFANLLDILDQVWNLFLAKDFLLENAFFHDFTEKFACFKLETPRGIFEIICQINVPLNWREHVLREE